MKKKTPCIYVDIRFDSFVFVQIKRSLTHLTGLSIDNLAAVLIQTMSRRRKRTTKCSRASECSSKCKQATELPPMQIPMQSYSGLESSEPRALTRADCQLKSARRPQRSSTMGHRGPSVRPLWGSWRRVLTGVRMRPRLECLQSRSL